MGYELSGIDGHPEPPTLRTSPSNFEALNEQINELKAALLDINEQKDMLTRFLLSDEVYSEEAKKMSIPSHGDSADRNLEDILLLEEECIR